MISPLDKGQQALVDLGQALRAVGYRFVTPTPETHRRVNRRRGNGEARSLRDIFGWSLPFHRATLSPELFELCSRAEVVVRDSDDPHRWRSLVRYSTLSLPHPETDLLLVHSAFPTDGSDAVFFGPDSYRFAAFIASTVRRARRLVDVGCGTGVGGLVLAGRVEEVVLADVNAHALRLAAVNVALARAGHARSARIGATASNVLMQIDGDFDLVIANPPYLVDESRRLYRDGGGNWGTDLAVRITDESLRRLVPGGQLILYTGTPIVDGRSVLAEQLLPALQLRAASWTWQELDPDVFGEELDGAAYLNAERLAVVGLSATVR